MKKAKEKVETRGQDEDPKEAKKRKSKVIEDISLENEEIGYEEKKKRRERNVHRLENTMENISGKSQEMEDEISFKKRKKTEKSLDRISKTSQEIEDNSKEKKKKGKKEKNSDKLLGDESQEIGDHSKEKKKKKEKAIDNGSSEKEKKKKRKIVIEDDTTEDQKTEKSMNKNVKTSLENENKEKKKKRKMEKENVSVEDQETKKKKRKENNFEPETENEKTKKQKSRKSKSKEDTTLCFVKNDEKEGLKNIIVNENGELEDDMIEKINSKKQVKSGDEKQSLSKNDETHETLVKKKKKKKEKITNSEIENPDASDKASAGEEALLYLRMWKDDRSKWTFKKVRQVWLLKHMFDTSKIPDNDFEVLLLYLEGLQGMARKTTVSRAEALLDSGDDEQKPEGFDLERVKRLLQILI